MELMPRSGLPARVRAAVPDAVRERARLLLAQGMEQRLRRSSAVRAAAIVFHAVAPRGGDREFEIDPAVEAQRLEAVIRYLVGRYVLVRASELPSAGRSRKPGGPVPIALTFDDDLASHRDHAVAIFERHDAIGTVFLCGARSPFWWQLLQIAIDTRAIAPNGLPHVAPELVDHALERRRGAIRSLARSIEGLSPAHRDVVADALGQAVPEGPPMLGPGDAAALAAAGWEIGFHTRGHYLLSSLGDDALQAELEPSALGSRGSLPRTLAYPHGKATAREADAARRAGYVAAFTGYASVLTDQTDDHLIGRLQPDTGSLGRFALQLARALSAA